MEYYLMGYFYENIYKQNYQDAVYRNSILFILQYDSAAGSIVEISRKLPACALAAFSDDRMRDSASLLFLFL